MLTANFLKEKRGNTNIWDITNFLVFLFFFLGKSCGSGYIQKGVDGDLTKYSPGIQDASL
jgi:hypothetical protein